MLNGKIAIVTGGTRGIGLAVVRTFLHNGAKVALFGSRETSVQRALAQLREEQPDWPVMGRWPDLTDYAAVERAVQEVAQAFGGVDILVNNAGISAREPLADYSPEAFRSIMDLNVTAVFHGCKAVEPIMRAAGKGCIINTSSMVSLYGQPSGVGYPTSKFAVNGLTRSLARELGRAGIRVNAVPRPTRLSLPATTPTALSFTPTTAAPATASCSSVTTMAPLSSLLSVRPSPTAWIVLPSRRPSPAATAALLTALTTLAPGCTRKLLPTACC